MKRIFIVLISLIIVGAIFYILKTKELFVPIAKSVTIDHILIEKSNRVMSVYSKGELIKTYKVSLGSNSKGPKQFEGDKKTPEGVYFIDSKNSNSSFHKNLGISYPNQDDKKFAESQGKNPGGDIKIHGLMNGFGFIGELHRLFDWTSGCIAVTNQEIDELYEHVSVGAKFEIRE